MHVRFKALGAMVSSSVAVGLKAQHLWLRVGISALRNVFLGSPRRSKTAYCTHYRLFSKLLFYTHPLESVAGGRFRQRLRGFRGFGA